ncbi:MAG: lysine 2,3-aminomutase, partial [Desulfuromusa sp.]|nr:lysine 2,3-aminomutase [Desulfuromusa sp.]
MSIYSNTQQKIAEHLSGDDNPSASMWTDWHWQLKHSTTRVETFERLLDIQLEPLERRKVELTLKKFPLSITPYYLS